MLRVIRVFRWLPCSKKCLYHASDAKVTSESSDLEEFLTICVVLTACLYCTLPLQPVKWHQKKLRIHIPTGTLCNVCCDVNYDIITVCFEKLVKMVFWQHMARCYLYILDLRKWWNSQQTSLKSPWGNCPWPWPWHLGSKSPWLWPWPWCWCLWPW